MPFVPLQPQQPERGFIPLQAEVKGFIPLESQEPEPPPGLMRNVALNNPLAGAGETALNLASQAVALPVAGIAGLAAEAGNALGLTDKEGADVVHDVAGAMTYQPRGELGRAGAALVAYPFEKLAEGAQYAGEKTLEVTGSPLAATAVDTTINALPMALGVRRPNPELDALYARAREPVGFMPTPEHAATTKANAAMDSIARSGSVDEAIHHATAAIDAPLEMPRPAAPISKAAAIADPGMLPERGLGEPNLASPDLVTGLQNSELGMTAPVAPVRPGDVQAKVDIGSGAIVSTAGVPYKTESGARLAQHAKGLQQTHEIARVGDGFGLMPRRESSTGMAMPGIEQPMVSGQRMQTEPIPRLAETPQESINASHSIADIPEAQKSFVAPYRGTEGDLPLQQPIGDVGIGFNRLEQLDNPKISARLDQPDASMSSAPKSGFTPIEAMESKPLDVPMQEMQAQAAGVQNSWAPGANHVGVGIDRPATGVTLTDKPIRREDVLIPFMQALDTTLYEGRVKGKNRLGFYRPRLEEVRIKNKSDLEVAAHEIAHLIDDRVPEIKKAYLNDKTLREELRGVSYDSKKINEGFAEFVRLYMTQPEQAKAKAPNYYRWFDNLTQRHEYGKAIQDAQRGMSAWFNQDALHRAQSKIGMQKDLNSALNGVFDKFRQSTLDDLHGLYRMERDLTGKINPLGAYEISRNTRGAGGMIDGSIRLGAPVIKPDKSFGFAGKGLEKILEPVANDLDSFLHYAVGRSARELQMQGREKLFTREEVKAMLALEKPEYKQAFNDYQQWNSAVLDFAEAHGVVNPHIRKLFSRQQYIPFYRAGQPGAYNVGGVTGNWSGIKKLTGGDENLRPILGNMIQNASMLIEASLKNEARLKIVELAKLQGGGKFLTKIEADQRPVKIDKLQVKDELLKAAGIDPAAARRGMLDPEQARVVEAIDQAITQAPEFFEFLLHNQAPSGNVMAVLRNGKPEYYEVADPLLFRAVQSLNRPAQNWVVRLLGMPKRVGQATITLTPDFMMGNIARDTLMATVMSKSGFKPFVDSVRGMASRIKSDPAYQEFIANGGGFASYLRDEQTFRAHLERFYTSKGIDYKTVLDTPDKLLYGIETIADAFEMSSRLGEYKRLRVQGEHPRHAAYAAREISTDFAMRGDSKELGFLYDTVMFLRPAVLSFDRLARGLAHDENKGAIAAKAGTMALMSVGLYLLNRDKPEYQDLPDWDKDANWHFFVPQQDGSTVHLRYPKIWEIGAMASVAERTTGKLLDDDPELGGHVADIVRNTFNLNLMPQIVAPLYEQATNRNSFTKAPLETPGMENVQPFLRAKPGTSETMKALGMATRELPEGYQVPPARAEALLRGYFNTWAMYGLMLTDSAFFGKQLPERRLDEMPVVRRFYEGTPAKHTKYEEMFYDMLGEAERLRGTMRELDDRNQQELADEKEKEPLSTKVGQLGRAQKRLSTINKDMQAVRQSDASREEKRRQLDALTVERNELLRKIVKESEGEKRE
jgi:hypothetical protein